ncbi:MAG: selenide, water dikinase SelD [Henriciella sp.]|nr:selenide, water dikinase SelD [Henriciella sp.]
MISTIPITRDLVLLGGGHTHALVLRKWAMKPLPGVQVTLVNPDVKAPYTGMLPGFVAGHYQRKDLDIDLVRLARAAGARLIVDRAIGLDPVAQTVQLADRPDIAFDILSIDIGISSRIPNSDGPSANIIPAKPLGPFADAWDALIDRVSLEKRAANISIIGAGVAGVELALAMAHRLRSLELPAARIELIEATSQPMRELNSGVRRNLIAALVREGIALITDASMDKIDPGSDFIVSTAGASPHAWLADTSLALEDGFICVDKHLQSLNTPGIFAAGDCAHLTHAPRPKAGVFAVRQAPVLFDNLRTALSTGKYRAYHPQQAYLKLISKGDQSALTDKWGIGLSGKWVWRWKDRIDRAFMTQFTEPVAMPAPDLPQQVAQGVIAEVERQKNACGGCGAKVSQDMLSEGLRPTADETSQGRFEDAAIVQTNNGYDVFSTDHLRAFNADPYVLAKVAAIHALGDIWAMGAVPKMVLAQIILPPLVPDKQSAMLTEIMQGARDVFDACGVTISGGHTSSGAELTIGFSISGSTSKPPLTHIGARPGDVLVLTKPIGTGVILAAEMQQRLDGDDYQAALSSMCRLQQDTSRRLSEVASTMTDVTGFGLAGHLLNILDASKVGSRLSLDKLPFLPGAIEASENGIRSTLYPANARLRDRVQGKEDARLDLLFDPQTCGGMLATIPAEKWGRYQADFQASNDSIWQIGTIIEGPAKIRVA